MFTHDHNTYLVVSLLATAALVFLYNATSVHWGLVKHYLAERQIKKILCSLHTVNGVGGILADGQMGSMAIPDMIIMIPPPPLRAKVTIYAEFADGHTVDPNYLVFTLSPVYKTNPRSATWHLPDIHGAARRITVTVQDTKTLARQVFIWSRKAERKTTSTTVPAAIQQRLRTFGNHGHN